MKKSVSNSNGYDARMARSSMKVVAWIFIWTLTMVLVDKAELYEWHSSSVLSAVGIGINALIGAWMVYTFMRFLGGLDDLQRKIQQDALAFSVGVGLVGGTVYSLMQAAGFISEAEASDVILLLMVSYSAAVIFGQVRYK